MDELVAFLERLFTDGVARVRQRLAVTDINRPQIDRLLRDAHAEHALSVAGPTLGYDAEFALRAAQILADACWFLFGHDEPGDEVERALLWQPESPAADRLLSADLCLRYLPEIYRRSRATDAGDVLTRSLAQLLRRWPLVGVLAGLLDGPTGDLTFAGHPGLQMLYAERLTREPQPTWVPAQQGATGSARERVELVFARLGLTVPLPLQIDKESA